METTLIEKKISWTPQELQEWMKAGLLPADLFEAGNQNKLINFLATNIGFLHSHFKSSDDEIYEIVIPPPSSWEHTSELHVIDKRTGKIVNILEQMKSYELCDGISLKIKAREQPEWERETAKAKRLSKKQNEVLKSIIKEIGPERPLTKTDIINIIEEVTKKTKTGKYRQSGHLIDQKLKCNLREDQMSLFDLLQPETKEKIDQSQIEMTAEGIKLTYAENKLVHALNLLLHEKSQNSNPKEENFYAGNAPFEVVPYGVPDQQAKAPVIKFKPAELYRAFMGSTKYSGSDVKFIVNTLYQLESKKVLIKYDRVKKIKDGNKVKTLTDRIEDFQSLIKIVSIISDLTDSEKEKLDDGDMSIREAKGEIIVALNPIFRDQIDTKFIEFPEDTNRRLVIAAGGHRKVTASMQTLMEYILREISAKRFKIEINEENLPRILGLENLIKQRKSKMLNERIQKDIQAMKNMGLILKAELLPNTCGGMKWLFIINKDYD